MGIYEQLGVRRIVNANARLTRLGGSVMPPVVQEAMREAAASFVDMHLLQQVVSRRLAELTRNEAALVSTGASAGLFLSTLACITGRDLPSVGRLLLDNPVPAPRHEVIIQAAQRNPYDPAIKLAGARLVQVGNVLQTFPWELESAIGERTAAILYIAGSHLAQGALPLEQVIAIGHRAGVPVIVDAAAQLPPPSNLWHFTQQGADLVVFSGGKALRGPQASGFIVGRKELIEACELHASPHQRLGRPMKVGKEEMVGLLAAVEWYLAQDHAALAAWYEQVVTAWAEQLGRLPGISVRRDFPNEAGQPIPRAIVEFSAPLELTADTARQRLLDGEPSIDIAIAGAQRIYLNPESLEPGEDVIVAERMAALVCEALESRRTLT